MRREARLGSLSCVCTCTRDFQANESDGNSILCLLQSHSGGKLIQAQGRVLLVCADHFAAVWGAGPAHRLSSSVGRCGASRGGGLPLTDAACGWRSWWGRVFQRLSLQPNSSKCRANVVKWQSCPTSFVKTMHFYCTLCWF